MRKGSLAALTVLLVGHGLTFAQQHSLAPSSPPNIFNPDPVNREPRAPTSANLSAIGNTVLPMGDLPDEARAQGDVDDQTRTFGYWGLGEYLFWWIKNGRVPPLVTAGGDGVLGSPGTRVLVDNLDFDNDVRQGGRFAVGYQFESHPCFSVEANCFFLADRQSGFRISSDGNPFLAQPFIDVVTGRPDATVVAEPGIAAGTATIGARMSLWGAEANLAARLIRSDRFHLTALGGFRFLSLEDEVTSGEQFQVAANVPGFGGSRVALQDEFRTLNQFYGGQVGLETGVQFGLLTVDFRGKLALGQLQQVADVNGATTSLSPNGTKTIFQGGLYALRSNFGRHQRDELAFIPEVGLNVGFLVTRYVKVTAGYSFLWVSTVARAGEQIDPVVNVSQFPIRSGNGPLVGPARPAFNFVGTDFWAQGLSFGLELRY